jgi:Kef-type K+ transport system membrane component KefB
VTGKLFILLILLTNMALLKQTKITKPDFVEASLVLILACWIIAVIWLLKSAITAKIISIYTMESLNVIFLAFTTIVLLVIAVIMADIRKELKGVY